MSPQWALDLIGQCRINHIPVWFKQTGSVRGEWPGVTGKGDDPEQWPAEFRVQQMPNERTIMANALTRGNPND